MEYKPHELCFEFWDYIEALKPREKVEIIYHLYKGEWIDILPCKPDGWDDFDQDEKSEWSDPIIRSLELQVGDKAVRRYTYKRDMGWTDQEVDDWWDSFVYRRQDPLHNSFYNYQSGKYERNNSNSLAEFIISFCLGGIATSLLLKLVILFTKLG